MFQAFVAVNVETGDMFLRITQSGEFVPALSRSGALTSACLHVHVGRTPLFSFPCRSQRCHDISRMAQVNKSSALCHTHFLSCNPLPKMFSHSCRTVTSGVAGGTHIRRLSSNVSEKSRDDLRGNLGSLVGTWMLEHSVEGKFRESTLDSPAERTARL